MNTKSFQALFAAALLACAATGYAQDAAPSASPSDSDDAAATQGGLQSSYVQRIAAMLGFTDAQATQIKTILEASETQSRTILENPALPQDQKSAQLSTLKTTALQQINALLTPEQQQQLSTFLHQFHLLHHSHRK